MAARIHRHTPSPGQLQQQRPHQRSRHPLCFFLCGSQPHTRTHAPEPVGSVYVHARLQRPLHRVQLTSASALHKVIGGASVWGSVEWHGGLSCDGGGWLGKPGENKTTTGTKGPAFVERLPRSLAGWLSLAVRVLCQGAAVMQPGLPTQTMLPHSMCVLRMAPWKKQLVGGRQWPRVSWGEFVGVPRPSTSKWPERQKGRTKSEGSLKKGILHARSHPVLPSPDHPPPRPGHRTG